MRRPYPGSDRGDAPRGRDPVAGLEVTINLLLWGSAARCHTLPPIGTRLSSSPVVARAMMTSETSAWAWLGRAKANTSSAAEYTQLALHEIG